MNWTGLETYNESSPIDVRERALRENFSRIGSLLGKTGVNLLSSVQTKAQYQLTSATNAPIPEYSVGFVTSGGLVEIEAYISVYTTGNADCLFSLELDGNIVTVKENYNESTNCVAIKWVQVLPPGNHSVRLLYANTVNATYMNPAGRSWSEMFIKEFLF